MKIGLDVDGILADFYLAMCQRFNMPYETLTTWQVDWIDNVFHKIADYDPFWAGIPLLNPAEAINFDVSVYVSALPPQMHKARKYWLEKHKFPEAPLICSNTKIQVLKDLEIDLFIDDKHSTVVDCNNAGIRCLKYIPKYMNEAPSEWDIKHLYNAHKL